MKEIELKNNILNIEFLFGYCMFSWKNILLSKNLGFYSSVYHEGKWFDSRYANWQIMDISNTEFILYGEWLNFPHRQTWHIKLSGNSIYWGIKGNNLEEFKTEMIQQNLAFIPSYTHWEVRDFAKGIFPDFFSNYRGLLWDRIWSMPQIEGTVVSLWSENENIPLIKWESTHTNKDTLMAIENSDAKAAARILQMLYVNPFSSGIKEESPIQIGSILNIE